MATGAPLYFVRPDENWVDVATGNLSASSEQFGYEANWAKSLNPDHPWWAGGGSASLTASFSGALETGVVALINNNADAGTAITVTGVTAITPLVGARDASGYPKDLATLTFTPGNDAPSVSGITVSISGNSNAWAIGELVAGRLRTLPNFLNGAKTTVWRGQEIDDGIPTYGSDIRYDVGVDHMMVEGEILCETTEQFQELHDWWMSTRCGFFPTLVIFDENRYPPMYARMHVGERVMEERLVRCPVKFVSMGRGLEVVTPVEAFAVTAAARPSRRAPRAQSATLRPVNGRQSTWARPTLEQRQHAAARSIVRSGTVKAPCGGCGKKKLG